MMIRPVKMNCQKESTLMTTIPTRSTASRRAPKKVPRGVPFPPAIRVPPIAAAAMALVSYPLPAVGSAEPRLASITRPATAAQTLQTM